MKMVVNSLQSENISTLDDDQSGQVSLEKSSAIEIISATQNATATQGNAYRVFRTYLLIAWLVSNFLVALVIGTHDLTVS